MSSITNAFFRVDYLSDSPSGKTKIYEVITNDRTTILGYIKWHGAWRKYCFYPEKNTLYDPKCLNELAQACEEKTQNIKINNMDFCIIPPTNYLDLANKGQRYFCLAQLYRDNSEYRNFFEEKVYEGKWVILDNGIGDHNPVTMNELLEITCELNPSEVIPPDVLNMGIQTIQNLETFITKLHRLYDDNALGAPPKILGVPQGRSRSEWLFVYEYMSLHPHVDTIGFSKIGIPFAFLDETNDKKIKEARHMAYDTLMCLGMINKPIHLLGMGDVREMLYYRDNPLMRSTDSCNTVWSGMNGIVFEQGNFERIPTPRDYFERTMSLDQVMYAEANIEWFKNLVHK